MSTAYKVGSYFRDATINILFVTAGLALLYRKQWGRKLGLVIIVISVIYSGNAFAWGFTGGEPTFKAYLFAYSVVGSWNAIWFCLLFKKSSKLALEPIHPNISNSDS
ncbi:hypothetical protein [Aliamphritea ceti]|uniref:hypothetical protein n=1 Tax=Aliamphritea ceti TaxID=1524258 RepID=UPI0021C365A0|nr:hypothetical protein [Aliamphritea ceti]